MFAGNNSHQVHSQKGLGDFLPISLLGCWAQQHPRPGWTGFGVTWSSGMCPCPQQGVGMRWSLGPLQLKPSCDSMIHHWWRGLWLPNPFLGDSQALGAPSWEEGKQLCPTSTPSLGLLCVYKWRQPGRKILSPPEWIPCCRGSSHRLGLGRRAAPEGAGSGEEDGVGPRDGSKGHEQIFQVCLEICRTEIEGNLLAVKVFIESSSLSH